MTQAQQALAAIKVYKARRTSREDVPGHRRTLWEDVIKGAEGYNEEATAEADPSERNEEAVFADSSGCGGTMDSTNGKPGLEQTGLSLSGIPASHEGTAQSKAERRKKR